jgi:predicted nuclease with TOPRIM domain
MERLNHQIDFLTKENGKYEEDNKKMERELSRSSTLREVNRKLESQVQELTDKLEELGTRL